MLVVVDGAGGTFVIVTMPFVVTTRTGALVRAAVVVDVAACRLVVVVTGVAVAVRLLTVAVRNVVEDGNAETATFCVSDDDIVGVTAGAVVAGTGVLGVVVIPLVARVGLGLSDDDVVGVTAVAVVVGTGVLTNGAGVALVPLVACVGLGVAADVTVGVSEPVLGFVNVAAAVGVVVWAAVVGVFATPGPPAN